MEVFLQSENFITALIASGFTLLGVLVSQGIGFWKLKSEHKYERQIFLRQKYEELSFRIIDFTNILKNLSSQLTQEGGAANINTSEFGEKGAKIEIITVLYFPELITECMGFLDVSNQFLKAHDINNSSHSHIDNLSIIGVRFNEKFDEFYRKIRLHTSDYT